LAIDRAGLNQSDGATHHGIFDVSFLSAIPEMTIFTPATYEALSRVFKCAVTLGKPSAIRYPNAVEDDIVRSAFYGNETYDDISVRSFALNDVTENVIITHGRMASTALEAAAQLMDNGITCSVLLCEFIKPYDALADIISDILPYTVKNIVFLEEEILSGGFGMNLSFELRRRRILTRARHKIIAVDDNFAVPEKGESVWQSAQVDSSTVVDALIEMIEAYK
jgi:1-deoxy-D-xylulose-5-phosphate synthase